MAILCGSRGMRCLEATEGGSVGLSGGIRLMGGWTAGPRVLERGTTVARREVYEHYYGTRKRGHSGGTSVRK